MTTQIPLKPVKMTPALMQKLENRKLIIRLCPKHHELPAKKGKTLGKSIYESDVRRGPHKLITVTVNCSVFGAFGSHPDNEEFLLIGDPATKPLYLVVSLFGKKDLVRKVKEGRLSAKDFVCLRVKYNDAAVSFFTMLADVPHAEAVADTTGRPASFYVTEPRDIGFEPLKLAGYELRVPQG
jgi:hypothetical protein